MTIEENTITCDRYGCRTQDSFEGELSPEETLIRFHVLGGGSQSTTAESFTTVRFTSDARFGRTGRTR